jgi:hypothetical protein
MGVDYRYMKTQNLVIMVVVLLIILLGALYFARPVAPIGAVPANNGTAANTQPQSVTTPGGLTFSYADPYALAATPEEVQAQAVIPACDQGFQYCIYRTGTQYAGTNFESAGISINERADLSSQATCITTQPEGYTGLKPTTKSQNGFVTGVFAVGGAAAGSSESGAVYRAWDGKTCHELRTRVAESQFANYPAGSKVEFTSADRQQVFVELQSILNEMTINGTSVGFPSAPVK